MSKGIDVSKWQGKIDWAKVKADGVDFAMLRCGFGRTAGQEDKFFEENCKNAKAVGMPIGAYHYSYADTVEKAEDEADFCYSIIKGKQFEYPIAFDIEDAKQKNLGKEKISAITKAFCDKMEKYGYYVVVYANKSWLENYFTDEIFEKYGIWLAQWASKPTFKKPIGMWQYTSGGTVNGISGRVDMNEAYKDYPHIMKANGLNGFTKGDNGFHIGDVVFVKAGAKDLNTGKPLADWAYKRSMYISDLKGNRAVLRFKGTIITAMDVKDLKHA